MQKKIVTYGKYSLEYYEVFENRKSFFLTIKPNGSVILKVPNTASAEKTEKFLQKKWRWIEKQKQFFEKYRRKSPKKKYVSGETFLYLGRQYQLTVEKSDSESVKFSHGKISILTSQEIENKECNKNLLENWYFSRAEKIFRERYKLVFKKFNYDFIPELALRKMEKRWGSFLSQKKILLNPELIKASKECIDYVITHELCHMEHKNHSENFYQLLSSKIPHWKSVKEKLEMRFV